LQLMSAFRYWLSVTRSSYLYDIEESVLLYFCAWVSI
jgi:hypothetical protein